MNWIFLASVNDQLAREKGKETRNTPSSVMKSADESNFMQNDFEWKACRARRPQFAGALPRLTPDFSYFAAKNGVMF